ncbi:MAG: sialidase family protein, partial [Pseudomonas sp.]
MRKSIAAWKLARFGVLTLALLGCTRKDSLQVAIGAVIEIPSPATGSAGEPNLALGRGDTVYLSWIEQQPDSSQALRFTTWNDQVLAAPRTIAQGKNWFVNWADFPMISALPDGTLAAHWLQRSDTGRYSYDVQLTVSRDGGQSWSAPVRPHRDEGSGEHGFVSTFPMGDRFGVVWLDGRKHAAAAQAKSSGENGVKAEMSVRFTTLSPSGQLGADSEIDGRACDCCQTAVTVTGAGPLLVYRDRSADEIRDIYVRRYIGNQWTEGVPVH